MMQSLSDKRTSLTGVQDTIDLDLAKLLDDIQKELDVVLPG